MYEDFQCPHCRDFEKAFGPTISKLIDSGAVAADYYMVSILNCQANHNYSTRAASAAYCVADESKEAFTRFHSALFAACSPRKAPAARPTTPSSSRPPGRPARRAASRVASTAASINEMVDGLGRGRQDHGDPDHQAQRRGLSSPSTPDDLIAKVTAIVGPVADLQPALPTPAPAPRA